MRDHRHLGGRVAQRHRGDDRQVAARAVAGEDQRRDRAAQLRRAARHPARRRFAIVGRGGPFGFGREAVIDRDHRQIEHARHLRGEAGMAVEVADHEPAAMEEHHRRPRLAAGARVEQPRRDVAGRSRDIEVEHRAELADRRVGDILHHHVHRARRRRLELVHLRPRHAGQIIEESAGVGADEGLGHAAILSSIWVPK